jgi:hypothetical protein
VVVVGLANGMEVDVVLDDVFQLLSLSFLTVGVRSAPATYASLTTVKVVLWARISNHDGA